MEGQVEELIKQTKKFEEELKTEYKNTREEWRKQLIKLKVKYFDVMFSSNFVHTLIVI